jgi:two-component system response regulator MtrA
VADGNRTTRGRVLIVDDDTALSEMLSIVLRNEGYDTYLCATGDKALAAFRDAKPDLVLLDLMSGADDYVVKPFKPKELVARIRARLRRMDEPGPESLSIGDLTIDVAGHSVKRAGETIQLTPLEFDLLVCLASKPWQVFTREVLLEQVWGYRHAADTRLVNVHVQRLRSKIERDPEHPEIVVTVRGVGYKAGGD